MPQKMLFLYRGWNSGTNEAVLNAWRKGSPAVEIEAYDVGAMIFPGLRSRLWALPHALRKGGAHAVLPGPGSFSDMVKGTAWYMERLVEVIDRLQRSATFDFSLGVGPLIMNPNPAQPHFVFNDGTLRTPAGYPGGERRLDFWRECFPYEEASLKRASMVFTMSEHVRRSVLEQYDLPSERVLRVNAGCNSPLTCRPEEGRYRNKNILFVGVQWGLKGGPQLVEAFGRVRRKHPKASLTIVGCKPRVSGPGVEIVGPVPQQDVSKHLAKATCFCMVSRGDAFGIAYLEAMRAGLPVVASDLGATPDFVLNGITGYRVHHDDIDSLADRINELLDDPDKCRRMGEQARSLVESEYTWEGTQRKMWEAIHRRLC